MQVRDVVLHKLISGAVAAVWLVSSRPGLKDGTSRRGRLVRDKAMRGTKTPDFLFARMMVLERILIQVHTRD